LGSGLLWCRLIGSNTIMRLHILSDLHLEFAPFQPENVDSEVVVLAGDIHTGTNGIKWILQTFTRRPVIYVLGNHEFYGESIPDLISEIKELAKETNVHVLENDEVIVGNVVFLGATLWTDFRVCGDPALAEVTAQMRMADCLRIRVAPLYRRLRPSDSRTLHEHSLKWLVGKLEQHRGEKIVVVTHHAPSPQSIMPQFRNHPLSAAFASNLEPLIADSGAALWVHGHLHHHWDYLVGSTRILANPRGYPNEPQTGFDPSLVLEV